MVWFVGDRLCFVCLLWLESCSHLVSVLVFFFQAEDGIRDAQESRGLGDVYKRQTGILAVSVASVASTSNPGSSP